MWFNYANNDLPSRYDVLLVSKKATHNTRHISYTFKKMKRMYDDVRALKKIIYHAKLAENWPSATEYPLFDNENIYHWGEKELLYYIYVIGVLSKGNTFDDMIHARMFVNFILNKHKFIIHIFR